MTQRLLRLAFVFEFLVALVAIFTAWSEVGGQSALDLMNWYWKLSLSALLAAAIVGYSSAIALEEQLWTLRSARWLTGVVVLLLAMGAITYYFELQVDNGETDESRTMSDSKALGSVRLRS